MNMLPLLFAGIFSVCFTVICHPQKQGKQINNDHFIPREFTVFKDDFSKDGIGSFPANWDAVICLKGYGNEHRNKWSVRQENGTNTLIMNTSVAHIFPKENLAKYLADSFTMECDYFLETTFSDYKLR